MSDQNKNIEGGEELNSFGVPNGYFNTSAANLLNKLAWEEEHRDFPRLVEMRKNDFFVTPNNYFEVCEKNLELIPYEKLNNVKRENNFSTPAEYFNRTSPELEEKLTAPVLATISKQNMFRVDDKYFEVNEKALREKLEVKQNGRIVHLFRKRILYPAAAILVVTLSIIMYNSYFSISPVQDCGTIACLDKDDLVKSSSLESIDDYELYDIVNTTVLEEKLGAGSQDDTQKKLEMDSNNLSTEELMDEI